VILNSKSKKSKIRRSQMYDFHVSTSTISRITNAVASEVVAWQNLPLDKIYLIVWIDGLFSRLERTQKSLTKPFISVGLNC